MKDNLLSEILEALIVIRGLIVQKTKLISDCNRLLKDLLDSLLLESSENKRQFIRACICGLQIHGEERKGRTSLVNAFDTMFHSKRFVEFDCMTSQIVRPYLFLLFGNSRQ